MAISARIDELKKRFDENPRRFFAPLANEYRKAGDLEQAIALCRQHLAEQPGNLNGQIVFGQALFESGDHVEARTAFEAAIGLDPENLIALRHLGDIARGLGEIETARGWYQRVLDADPRNDEIAGFLKELDALAAADSVLADVAPAAAGEPPQVAAAAEPLALEPMVPDPAPTTHVPPTAVGTALDTMPQASPVAPADPSTAPTVEFAPPIPPPTTVTPVAAAEPPDLPEPVRRPSPELLDLDAAGFDDLPPADPIVPAPVSAEADPGDASVWGGVPEGATDDAATFNAPDPPPESAFGSEFSLDRPTSGGAEPFLDLPAEDPRTPAVSAADDLGLEPREEFAPPVPSAPPPPPAPPGASDIASLFGDGGFAGGADVLPGSGEREGVGQGEPEPVTADGPVAQTPQAFVTETMAELYLQQGFRDQALEVYRLLAAQSPHDLELAERVRLLEAGERASVAVAVVDDRVIEHAAVAAGEETARMFFRRLAERRLDGSAGALSPTSAPADEVGQQAPPGATPAGGPTVTPVAPAPAVGASQPTPKGGWTLDALFGGGVPPADEAAAQALAGAFGTPAAEPVAPPSGRPTRPASDEFSLDRVFRGETARSSGTAPTPRASEALRFDQFFAPEPELAPGGAPDGANTPTDAGDLQQFQSWLSGLKGPQ